MAAAAEWTKNNKSPGYPGWLNKRLGIGRHAWPGLGHPIINSSTKIDLHPISGVCKCVETVLPTSGQKTVGNQKFGSKCVETSSVMNKRTDEPTGPFLYIPSSFTDRGQQYVITFKFITIVTFQDLFISYDRSLFVDLWPSIMVKQPQAELRFGQMIHLLNKISLSWAYKISHRKQPKHAKNLHNLNNIVFSNINFNVVNHILQLCLSFSKRNKASVMTMPKSFLTHVSWVKHMCQRNTPSLVWIMVACHLFGTKPISKPMLVYWLLRTGIKFLRNFNLKITIFIQENGFKNVVYKNAAVLSPPQCLNVCNLHNREFKSVRRSDIRIKDTSTVPYSAEHHHK